jgi:hypothetical protein
MAGFTYTFEEFGDHLAAMEMVQDYEHVTLANGETVELSGARSFENMVPRVMDYMRQIYPDEEEAVFKGACLVMILNHVATDIELFEDANLAVMGTADKPALVHPRAWRALHHFYAKHPLQSGHIETRDIIEYAKKLP